NYPNSLNYNGGYSASNFLSSSTPITLDPLTGDICFTPNAILSTVTGIKVEEWRTINGVPTLIGTVLRDLQMSVVQCSNSIPILSGMDTTLSHTYDPNDTTYIIDVCLSPDPIVFDINGYDADVYDPNTVGSPELFSINWNNGIPGGTFTTHYNGTDSAYANFSWLPTLADVGNIKCFTATVIDEACPYNGFQTFSYCITVHGMEVHLGSDTLLCEGESVNILALADTSTVNYIWSVNGTQTGTPLGQDNYQFNSTAYGPGSHTVSIETNDGNVTTACPGTDNLIVEVVYQPDVNGSLQDSAFCGSGSVTYDAGQGQQYTWTDLILNPVGASKLFTATNSGTYILTVNGGVNTRCYDVDTFEVVSILEPTLGPDTCIWKDDTPYKLDAGYIYGDLAYKWSDGSTGQFVDVTVSGTYEVKIYHSYISPTVSCSDKQIVNVIDKDNMILTAKIQATEDIEMEDFQKGDRDICTHQRLKVKGPLAPSGHSYDYTWYENGSQTSTSPVFIFQQENPGVFLVELEIKNGCKSAIEIKTKSCIVQIPNIITPNGDDVNDKFKIILKDSKEEFYLSFPNSTLIIYNRWGKKVFESNNYMNDWDGNGAADGVYYWTLELEDGKETQMQGTVTIMSK
ncbi:MAG: gliding motility-associated C-terminal domain-containing protein, partial [Chlamydiia bacterium]|nr:gliding motility-associated C-terminal domain-containing protein [Chlamydiia bacterium]